MRHLLTIATIAFVTVAPSAAGAQRATEVQLSPQEWRRINVFFSNFAEANVQPFERGEVPPATLIQFGVFHNLINAHQRVQNAPGRPNHGRLNASHVEAAVLKYFGSPLSQHQSLSGNYSWIEYANGYYIFPLADGETYPIAQVERVTDVGGGEFVATLSIYIIPDGDLDLRVSWDFAQETGRLRRS